MTSEEREEMSMTKKAAEAAEKAAKEAVKKAAEKNESKLKMIEFEQKMR